LPLLNEAPSGTAKKDALAHLATSRFIAEQDLEKS
jgi:hypothetical protein